MGSKEKKAILVVDDPVMQGLRDLAAAKGTTMRYMVTKALFAYVKAEKARLAAESNE